jgi:hypothetical protein
MKVEITQLHKLGTTWKVCVDFISELESKLVQFIYEDSCHTLIAHTLIHSIRHLVYANAMHAFTEIKPSQTTQLGQLSAGCYARLMILVGVVVVVVSSHRCWKSN